MHKSKIMIGGYESKLGPVDSRVLHRFESPYSESDSKWRRGNFSQAIGDIQNAEHESRHGDVVIQCLQRWNREK